MTYVALISPFWSLVLIDTTAGPGGGAKKSRKRFPRRYGLGPFPNPSKTVFPYKTDTFFYSSQNWRKSAQWFVLTRAHAELVEQDTVVLSAFARFCDASSSRDILVPLNDTAEGSVHSGGSIPGSSEAPVREGSRFDKSKTKTKSFCAPDEHYVATLLSILGKEHELEGRTVTYTNWWPTTRWHPKRYAVQEARDAVTLIMEKKSVDDVFDGGDRCGAFPLNTLRLRDLPKLVTVVHTSRYTRPAKGLLRPEGRIPSDCYPDCLRNTNPSYPWSERLTLSALSYQYLRVVPLRKKNRTPETVLAVRQEVYREIRTANREVRERFDRVLMKY